MKTRFDSLGLLWLCLAAPDLFWAEGLTNSIETPDLQVQEAVFRECFKNYGDKRKEVFFIDLRNAGSNSQIASLTKALRDYPVPIKSRSEAVETNRFGGVAYFDKATGAEGALFQIESLIWTAPTQAIVQVTVRPNFIPSLERARYRAALVESKWQINSFPINRHHWEPLEIPKR